MPVATPLVSEPEPCPARRAGMTRRSRCTGTTWSRSTSCAGRARRPWSTTSSTRTASCAPCSSATSSGAGRPTRATRRSEQRAPGRLGRPSPRAGAEKPLPEAGPTDWWAALPGNPSCGACPQAPVSAAGGVSPEEWLSIGVRPSLAHLTVWSLDVSGHFPTPASIPHSGISQSTMRWPCSEALRRPLSQEAERGGEVTCGGPTPCVPRHQDLNPEPDG